MEKWTRQFPLYTQLDQKDCGPTCLRMIAAFFGKKHSITDLRQRAFVSKEGTSLLGISAAAEAIGFKTVGVQLSLRSFMTESPFPCIVHWNQKHFVVVYDLKWRRTSLLSTKKRQILFVADPAGHRFKYTLREFASGWCSKQDGKSKGIALLFEPTPEFYAFDFNPTDFERKSFQYIKRYLKSNRLGVIKVLCALFVGCLLQIMVPFLTQSIVDKGIASKNIKLIYLILMGQFALILSMTVVDIVRRTLLLNVSNTLNISILSDFLSKLVRLPISFFENKNTGDILKRVDDHTRVEKFLSSTSLSVLFSFLTLIVFSVVLVYYDLRIFVIFGVGSLGYWIYIRSFLKRRRELDYKRFSQQVANQDNVIQLIHGMQEIKLNNCERHKLSEWNRIQLKLNQLTLASSKIQQYQEAGGILINEIKNIVITVVAAQAVINGEITLGAMLSIQYIIGQLNSPMIEFVRFSRELQDAKIGLERIGEVHSLNDEGQEAPQRSQSSLGPGAESITVDAVNFSYGAPENPQVLTDFSIEIPKGKVTALVGSSGSGKTTIVKLLLKFYAPTKGAITVGGQDLNDLNPSEWRSRCGVVLQDGKLFPDTIANNIALSEPAIDEKKLRHAIRIANLEKFVDSLPLSFNTRISGDGGGLSQGQKQRILIARAVYKDPDYLFFDEATSALDTINEKMIVENLDRIFRNKTVLVIAHRLSTVMHADQIVVIDQGRVAEVGTHKSLVQKQGYYFDLIHNQLNIPV
jgi:ATP-binding cassette subfamily B protein